jgi:FtsH-binding integral membrane protein
MSFQGTAQPPPIPGTLFQEVEQSRSVFIMKTYLHVFAAMLLFMGIEAVLFVSGLAEVISAALLSVSWLLVLGAFVIVSWFASRVAHCATSLLAQYSALLVYVVAEAIIFVPLLYIASMFAPGVIESAALVTVLGTGALTAIAFATSHDFSFLRSLLYWCMGVALVLIVSSVLFGFELGTWFSVAMIAVAGGAVLFDTSNIIHNYPDDRYVGAAMELFASIALMFWYIIQLFLVRD